METSLTNGGGTFFLGKNNLNIVFSAFSEFEEKELKEKKYYGTLL